MLTDTQDAINAVRSVMFDVATWQERIAEKAGTPIGPVTTSHEGGTDEHGGATSHRRR